MNTDDRARGGQNPIAGDDAAGIDPALVLAILEAEQRKTTARLMALTPLILIAWGSAWLLGFCLMWAGGVKVIPPSVASLGFALLLAGAVVFSAIAGSRMERGIKQSPSAKFAKRAFALACIFGFVALGAIGAALRIMGADAQLLEHFYPVSTVFFVGVMYAAAAAVWNLGPALWVGLGLIVLSVCGAFAPYPFYYALFAVFGGGAFLVYGIVLNRQVRAGLSS